MTKVKLLDFIQPLRLIKTCLLKFAIIFFSDGLVNGANGLFSLTTSLNTKLYIWIKFFNTNVGIATRFSNSHLYKNLDIESSWTPIEPIAKEIKLGKNQIHLLSGLQFPLQLIAARTIH